MIIVIIERALDSGTTRTNLKPSLNHLAWVHEGDSYPLIVATYDQERVYPHTKMFLHLNIHWKERVYSCTLGSLLLTGKKEVYPHTKVFLHFNIHWKERVYPCTLSCQYYTGNDLCVPRHYFNPFFPEYHWQERVYPYTLSFQYTVDCILKQCNIVPIP